MQGFRKYLTQARDHEELLSFLLGQLVKDKVRLHQLQRHEQPDLVTVKVAELDERVRFSSHFPCDEANCILQAKEVDIFDTSSFLKSKLFAANGFKLRNGVIEKTFRTD